MRDLHLLEEPGAVFPWIAIWGAVQRTGKGADHRTEGISRIFMFEIFCLAAWPAQQLSRRQLICDMWAHFCASQVMPEIVDGLIFQRSFYFVALWFLFPFISRGIHKYDFVTWPAEQLMQRHFLFVKSGHFCASQVMPTIVVGLIFSRYFICCRFCCCSSPVTFILSTYQLAEFFKARLEFKNSVLVQDTAEFSRHYFLVHFKRCFSAHMVTFSLFLCTRICGNMVWPVFFCGLGLEGFAFHENVSSRSVFGFRFLSF